MLLGARRRGRLGIVPAPPGARVLKSLGMVAEALSEQSSAHAAVFAVDGDPTTRWASALLSGGSQVVSPAQWWRVNLDADNRTVDEVRITWEGPTYGVDYTIETSVTLTGPRTIQATITGNTSTDVVHEFDEVVCRYVWIVITKRSVTSAANNWGISAFKIQVWGANNDGYVYVPPPPGPDPPPPDPDPEDPPVVVPPPTGATPVSIFTFKAGNPHTTRIPSNAPRLPDAEQEIRRGEFAYCMDRSSVGFEIGQWAAKLIVVKGDDVYLPDGTLVAANQPLRTTRYCGQSVLDSTPMPIHDVMDMPNGEGHLFVYNPETGMYWEFMKFGGLNANPGFSPGLDVGWGAGAVDLRQLREMNEVLPGHTRGVNAPDYWTRGTTAGSAAMGAVIILRHEMVNALARADAGDWDNAYIPHLIGYEAWRHTPNTWEWPGVRTDWTGSGPMPAGECPHSPLHQKVSSYGVGGCPDHRSRGLGRLPMGGIMTVPQSFNVATAFAGLGFTAHQLKLARIMTKTLQLHGAMMTDFGGPGIVFVCDRQSPGHPPFPDMGLTGPAESTNNAPWLKTLFTYLINNDLLVWLRTGPNPLGLGATYEAGAYRPPGFF